MWRSEDAIRELSAKGPWRSRVVSAGARVAIGMEYPHRADAQFMFGLAATVRIPTARTARQRGLVRVGKWTLAFGERVLRAIFLGQPAP